MRSRYAVQNALQMVNDEVAKGRLGCLTALADLKPAVDRHYSNFVQLAISLETAGKDSHGIRRLVANLLNTYGEDLLGLIEARQ